MLRASLSSPGAAAGAGVAGGPYPISISGAAGVGLGNYDIVYRAGSLAVAPAPLLVAADDLVRAMFQPNPPFSASFSGFVLGQGPGDLGGALAFATAAGVGSPPGAYRVAPYGLASANYAVSFADGTLLVLPLGGGELLRRAEHADAEEDALLREAPPAHDGGFEVDHEHRDHPGAILSLGSGELGRAGANQRKPE